MEVQVVGLVGETLPLPPLARGGEEGNRGGDGGGGFLGGEEMVDDDRESVSEASGIRIGIGHGIASEQDENEEELRD